MVKPQERFPMFCSQESAVMFAQHWLQKQNRNQANAKTDYILAKYCQACLLGGLRQGVFALRAVASSPRAAPESLHHACLPCATTSHGESFCPSACHLQSGLRAPLCSALLVALKTFFLSAGLLLLCLFHHCPCSTSRPVLSFIWWLLLWGFLALFSCSTSFFLFL